MEDVQERPAVHVLRHDRHRPFAVKRPQKVDNAVRHERQFFVGVENKTSRMGNYTVEKNGNVLLKDGQVIDLLRNACLPCRPIDRAQSNRTMPSLGVTGIVEGLDLVDELMSLSLVEHVYHLQSASTRNVRYQSHSSNSGSQGRVQLELISYVEMYHRL